ncbi:MAG: DMT family transporter [Caulobacteraceae bacterium]
MSERWKALAVLCFGAAVIGLAPILVRLADTGPANAGFWRLILAAPVLALMASREKAGRGVPLPLLAPLAGVFFALDLGFWHYGIANTSVANATVLTNLTPVVVTFVAWIAFKERPGWLFVAAVALAVAGAAMMSLGRGGGAPHPAPNPLLGDALSLTTALWYAGYLLAVGRARLKIGAARVMFWSSFVGAVLLLAASWALGEPLTPRSMGGWAAVFGLAAMHITGQGSIAWSLGRLPTATASIVVLIQPVVAAILGWLLFQEALGPWQAIGALAALSGIVLAQWSSARRAAALAKAGAAPS